MNKSAFSPEESRQSTKIRRKIYNNKLFCNFLHDFAGHMKEFFKEVEEARDLADKIDVKINEVKKLQNDILSSPKV